MSNLELTENIQAVLFILAGMVSGAIPMLCYVVASKRLEQPENRFIILLVKLVFGLNAIAGVAIGIGIAVYAYNARPGFNSESAVGLWFTGCVLIAVLYFTVLRKIKKKEIQIVQ
ncbi:hypothetical protein KKF55_04970 [Patescibacteria group bacterium]|nr:hypothetical protein [Patescibacteria group bacterium]